MTADVTVRAERLKLVSRAEPEKPALEEASQDEVDAAILLSKTKLHKRGDMLSVGQFVSLVAQLGGYTGKSSGGPPGRTVISRGLGDVVVGASALAAQTRI